MSLHILDLVQNSVEAGAGRVELGVAEDLKQDTLTIRVTDDGRGMSEETRRKVLDPFVTTRTTRRVGLGLPLIDMSTQRCGGYLIVQSQPGKGTVVEAVYRHSHLDRPPLGNMVETLKTIMVGNPKLDFCYEHRVNGNHFIIRLSDIREALGNVPLTHPDVLVWLHDYLTTNLANLYGGAQDENG
ncbi:Hypothetical protein LUCI_1557 [Lucifera butyrica]|uniref:histidine kinase n=1 Tax=Lucifera butyrica TaxID=1351585 RepID=A0A498R174_9FIRM|nr:Hypothetical protein LUCI_1557 [Lucifera butyrica]